MRFLLGNPSPTPKSLRWFAWGTLPKPFLIDSNDLMTLPSASSMRRSLPSVSTKVIRSDHVEYGMVALPTLG